MYRNNIDAKLLKRIQSKEFEESVDISIKLITDVYIYTL